MENNKSYGIITYELSQVLISRIEEKLRQEMRLYHPTDARFKKVKSAAVYDGSNAESCRKVQCLVVDDSVRSIEAGAFADCGELRMLVLPAEMDEIGSCAFANCENLSLVVMPKRINSLGERCFYGCSELDCVNRLDAVSESIGAEAFANCTSLEAVTVSAKQLGEAVFENCSSLCTVRYETSADVPCRAFKNCINLSEIYFSYPENIGDEAFDGCVLLAEYTNAIHADGVGASGERAGVDIEDVEFLPYTIETIGRHAFRNCKALVAFELPDHLRELGDGAFEGCEALEVIELSCWVKANDLDLGKGVFAGCNKLVFHCEAELSPAFIEYVIENGLSIKIGEGGEVLRPGDEALAAVRIGEQVIETPHGKFYVESGILQKYVGRGGSIELPDGIIAVSFDAYRRGQGEEGKRWEYIAIGDELIEYPKPRFGVMTIPAGVRHLKSRYGGTNCADIMRLILPEGLETICEGAFNGSEKLREISFPSTLKQIGRYSFEDCTGLRHLRIPGSLERLDHMCFCGCENLESVEICEGVRYLGKSAFANCYSLSRVSLPDSLEFIDNYAFQNCGELKEINLGDKVGIGAMVFNGSGVK